MYVLPTGLKTTCSCKTSEAFNHFNNLRNNLLNVYILLVYMYVPFATSGTPTTTHNEWHN